MISPWLDENLRKNYDDLVGFLEIFNKCGEPCQRSGLKFGYRNHDFEFKYSLNGKKSYDIILAGFYNYLKNIREDLKACM